MYHRLLVLLISLGAILLCVGNSLKAQPTRPKEDLQTELQPVEIADDIAYGPAVILGCKQAILYRATDSNKKTAVISSYTEKSFDRTKEWIFRNIYPILNQPRHHAKVAPEYYLSLFNDESNGMMGLLITIPLNGETLGPAYKDEIDELRQLMTVTTP